MKQHTQRFKEAITELGKQQSVLITYTIDNEEVILGVEEINSATPRYDADLLKSVMKELHLDSNVDIPVGTEINFKYGLLVDGEFEYLDYGNYIVYTSEKKEDTSSYEILCYDKMLYAMKEYEELNIRYPCTVMQYINAIATKMGLKVSSNNNKFPNYNTEIAGEFYLSIDEETKGRTSLGYTYRDILDDLAEVTASVICINEYDELEVRDIKDAINYKTTEKSKELKIESQLEAPIQLVTLDGESRQISWESKNFIQDGETVKSSKNNYVVYTTDFQELSKYAGQTIYVSFDAKTDIAGVVLDCYFRGTSMLQPQSEVIQIDNINDFQRYYIQMTVPTNLSDYTQNTFAFRNNAYVEGQTVNDTATITYKNIQIELNEFTEFRKYKTSSPSPEFPSEIQSVGDDVNLLDGLKKGVYNASTGEYKDNENYVCSNNSIQVEKNSKYVLSIDGVISRGYVYEYNSTGYIGRITIENGIYTSSNNVEYIHVTFEDGTIEKVPLDSKVKLQKGTVATAYSEYGKGTVEIKQSGKNLFSGLIKGKGLNGTTGAEITSLTQSASDFIYVDFDKNPNYYLSGLTNQLTSFVAAYNSNKEFLGRSAWNTKTNVAINKTIFTYGTAQGTGDIAYLRVVQSESESTTGTIDDIDNLEIQLEKGTEGTEVIEYEPYKGNNYVIPLSQPLRSLPNGVKDTIEEDGIHRRVGSVVLDGSDDEGWNKDTNTDNTVDYFYIKGIGIDKNNIDTVICNRFQKGSMTSQGFWATTVFCITINKEYTGIVADDTKEQRIAKFKTWLQQNPITVQYELAEEVIEPFDEEQQAVIDSIETFEGVNIISSNTELQIRYAIDQDTIDEEYLKDTNVNFGEVFGPVNAVVLSRSSSDNIYRNDVASINQNGLYEIKISDNQIMNQNNRDTFIQAIFDKLKGLTYGICDFSSTGIMYYDLLDRFNVKVGDNTYSIVMFHDEQNITQGLEENIFAEKPERSETDYTKADKTDQKLNQTNLIVDKQNQQISALVSSNTALEQKTAQLIIDVEGIKGQISDVADVTTTAEGYGTAELDNISGNSEPIYLRVYPTNEDILSLKPSIGLYPRVGLYSHSREIYIKNTSSQEPYQLIYNIPSDLYQLDGVYDEFVLTYEAKECYVIHRIGINENGEKYLLETETIESFDYPNLPLTEGDYQIYTPAFNMAYIYVRLMAKNIYTDQFATKVELKSTVEQTATDITTSVDKKLTNYDTKTEVNSKISQTATDITSTVSQTYETKSNANSKYSEIKQTTDSISSTVSKKVGNDEVISKINQSAEQVQINANKISLARKNS